jgi:DNA-binding response OmpR family regulator
VEKTMTQADCRVLVADDDPTVGLLMPLALAGQGFAVTMVDNGAAALLAFAQQPFDLVLLDVEMPEMSGLEVCAAIRQQSGMAVPVMLITGRTDAAFVARAAELDAGVIGKPVDWQRIGGELRRRLALTDTA